MSTPRRPGVRLRGLAGGRGPAGDPAAVVGISLHPSDQQGKIPLSEFLVPAQDQHGHSARLESRCPPSMVRDVNILVETKLFPWKNKSDFVRWAVVAGYKAASEAVESGLISNMSATTRTLIMAYQAEQANLDYRDTLDYMTKTISQLLSSGATVNAKRLVRETLASIANMDDAYWRKRYDDDFTERFGYLVGRKKS